MCDRFAMPSHQHVWGPRRSSEALGNCKGKQVPVIGSEPGMSSCEPQVRCSREALSSVATTRFIPICSLVCPFPVVHKKEAEAGKSSPIEGIVSAQWGLVRQDLVGTEEQWGPWEQMSASNILKSKFIELPRAFS